jgi:hypothetical protein
MADIVTIAGATRIYNAGSGDLVAAHNTTATNLNNELIAKLPLAGGTMTGNVNMDSKRIQNLPAPSDNAEPARKSDVDAKVAKAGDTMSGPLAMGANKITGLAAPTATGDAARKDELDTKVTKTGAETVAGVKTFSDAPILPHDRKRDKVLIPFSISASGLYANISGVVMSASRQLVLKRAGSVTSLSYCDASGNSPAPDTANFGAKAFTATEKIVVQVETNDSDLVKCKISGVTVLSVGPVAAYPVLGILEVELND